MAFLGAGCCIVGFRRPAGEAVPDRTRALLGAPVFPLGERSQMIFQVLAYAAVISWAMAPRMALPAIRFALLLYALGIGF